MANDKGTDLNPYLINNNQGPERNAGIKWEWAHRVIINPGAKVIYRFSFDAWFENAVIIYDMEFLDPLAERGNYSRTMDDFEFKNDSNKHVEHIITGWHKGSPPKASKPWYHSPKLVFPMQTEKVVMVGFSDDQANDGKTDPYYFNDGLVSIIYYKGED
ncbi:hypothetical protein [Lysinibacillus sphaericus]|uniref:hypothetical protein n=1 Tax=Lysinibacillus sphaericus TaxID=1421 RepID=UPI002DBC4897|nr:hypothetical protein [Lysinibacillus sphaericus]MEB7455148.1 hypothetical protein [Lysinibacillus sphaericus]